MGRSYNPNVNVIFNQTREVDAIRTLKSPFQADNLRGAFVLAKVENPTAACRLSFIVVGECPDKVEEFLAEKTRSGIAQGPLKHVLEDVEAVYELAKATVPFETE